MGYILQRNGFPSLIFLILLSLVILPFFSEVNATTSLTYQYDANGNLIQGDGKYYEYNDANQLIKVRHNDQNGPVLAEYFYDYTGQRIKKIENGVTTYYIGKHFEKQVDSVGSTTNTSYYFANGERVAKKDPSGNVYYYHLDHLGGTNVVTDSSGNLIERIKYYPFGEIREGGNEKYQFTGKEKDKLTDYYYYEARYYNSDFEHFTQADTVEPDYYDPQDLNRFAYVENNPLNYIDPQGTKRYYYLANNKLMKMSAKDKKALLSSLKNIPDLKGKKFQGKFGKFVEGGEFAVKAYKYFDEAMLASATGGKFGKVHKWSDRYRLLESIPGGLGFVFKSGKFFTDEMIGMASGGRYGKIHSISETYEVLESVPFSIGFMFSSGKYLSQDVLGELLYQRGWYLK